MNIQITSNVPFGHLVVEPHIHLDAQITVDLRSALDLNPRSDGYLMTVDAVGVRRRVEDRLSGLIAGKMLIWEEELGTETGKAALPEGITQLAFQDTVTPVRPTIEALTFLTAAVVCEQVELLYPDGGVQVAGVRFAETRRTAGVLNDDEVADAAALGLKLWKRFL